METRVFSVKEFLPNCNGSNYYDVAEGELNVSFHYFVSCFSCSVGAVLESNAPINVLPHLPPCGQTRGQTRGLY